MQRTVRILVGVGALLQALGLGFLILRVDLLCYDLCPPESDLAATIAQRIMDAAPTALVFALPMAVAWILCLVQLARLRRWGIFALLALSLPAMAGLALFVYYRGTSGHLLPTTWAAHNAGWDSAFQQAIALLLLWPVITFVATFTLNGRQTTE